MKGSEQMLTTLITVVSGVLVFAISEYLREIWVAPLQEYRKIKQRVSYLLSFDARYYSNVIENKTQNDARVSEYDKVSTELRDIACQIEGFIEIVSWPRFGIPSKKKLFDASRELIGLSNSMFSPDGSISELCRENGETANRIKSLLGIYSAKRGQKKANK